MKLNKLFIVSMMSAAMVLPQMATADSQLSIGPAGTTAAGNLDFTITIPDFVFFQIGSVGATVDRVDFDLGPTQPGSGGPILATGGSGDGSDGILNVTLITNSANVSIAATGGNLTSGADTIPFTDITAVDGGTLSVPDFGATISPFAVSPSTLNDTWTYTYDNSTVYNTGIYTGTVTYTVTTL